MKFRFFALYGEVNTSWSIHHELTKMLRVRLNDLGKEIKFFQDQFSDEFTLDITFSATRNNSEMVVNGPIVSTRSKVVEYVPIIPFIEGEQHKDQVLYVLTCLESCILDIFKKYQSDSTGISEVFEEVKCEFMNSYQLYS